MFLKGVDLVMKNHFLNPIFLLHISPNRITHILQWLKCSLGYSDQAQWIFFTILLQFYCLTFFLHEGNIYLDERISYLD